MINGIQQTDLTKLFAPGIRSAGLKTLEIVFQTPGGTLTLQQFEMIVESCAQLENFRVISFSWATHMVCSFLSSFFFQIPDTNFLSSLFISKQCLVPYLTFDASTLITLGPRHATHFGLEAMVKQLDQKL